MVQIPELLQSAVETRLNATEVLEFVEHQSDRTLFGDFEYLHQCIFEVMKPPRAGPPKTFSQAFGKILEIGSGIQVWVDVDVDRRHIVARRQCLQDETCFTDAASAGDNHKTTDGFVLHGGAELLQLKELAFATEERIFGSSRHLTPKNA